jgi:hypothetical protein
MCDICHRRNAMILIGLIERYAGHLSTSGVRPRRSGRCGHLAAAVAGVAADWPVERQGDKHGNAIVVRLPEGSDSRSNPSHVVDVDQTACRRAGWD